MGGHHAARDSISQLSGVSADDSFQTKLAFPRNRQAVENSREECGKPVESMPHVSHGEPAAELTLCRPARYFLSPASSDIRLAHVPSSARVIVIVCSRLLWWRRT